MDNSNFDVTLNNTNASYLLRGLDALNRSGCGLQDSANIINLSNMLNAKIEAFQKAIEAPVDKVTKLTKSTSKKKAD